MTPSRRSTSSSPGQAGSRRTAWSRSSCPTPGQLDGGSKKGTYLELGAGPTLGLPFWNAKLTVPLKAGFSLNNYYELLGSDLKYHDNRFGFFDIGGLITVPMSSFASRFGSWTVHGGADFLAFGDTTKAFDSGKKTKVVALVGIGMTY